MTQLTSRAPELGSSDRGIGLLRNKIAIVTGGLSGLGLATVHRFLDEGAKVVIADIQDAAGASLVSDLGDSSHYVHADVTSEADIASLVSQTVEHFGRLDIMFNNAGAAGDPLPIMEIGAEGFDKTLALLTRSVLLGHKYAALQFVEQGSGGSIISTASAAGLQGGWSGPAYTTAKHAVIGIVRQATAELAPQGIRSNAIAPGIIMTPIMPKAFGIAPERAQEFMDFLAERMGGSMPIGRLGVPDDVAKAATFLASDLAEYISGIVLPVDGGMTSVTLSSYGPDVYKAYLEFVGQGVPSQ